MAVIQLFSSFVFGVIGGFVALLLIGKHYSIGKTVKTTRAAKLLKKRSPISHGDYEALQAELRQTNPNQADL